tara:strand:+ start:455 stop:2653 length:2199 start_codon:yes stop_codon:yes gene_type:complete
MSNIKTDYAIFDVIDYKGEAKLSSYNLDITPLTFKARIPEDNSREVPLNNQKITFDFGDGSFGSNLSSSHVYEYPGEYTVRMVIRDCKNNSILASYSDSVHIKDYITNTFTLSMPPGDIANSKPALVLSAGEISGPITVTSKSPFYQDFQEIYYSISGNEYKNYFNLSPNKFNSLKKYFSIYEKSYLPTLSSYEFVEIDKISLSSTDIYARLTSDGAIVAGLSSSLSSVYVGSSGSKEIYVKAEDQDTPINISFFKDRENIFSNSLKGYKNNNYTNNFDITLSSFISPTSGQTLSAIKFTSTGITGEGIEKESFAISKTQYKGLGIPFIITPVNNDNFTMKSLTAGTPTFVLLSGASSNIYDDNNIVQSTYYTIESLANSLSNIDTDFWYRGMLTFNDNLSSTSTRLTLSARNQYTFNTNSSLLSTVNGLVTFSAYPKDFYNFYKQNEDFDFEQNIKDMRFQEILLDKNIFFDDFVGTIFGNISSRYDILGKKLYEKVFNFVSNNADIDICDVKSLISLASLTDDNGIVFDRALAQEPEQVKRFIDTLSINYNKFRGSKNKFDENYDPKGTTTKEINGRNLGPEVSSLTYEVTAGNDLVAYEKYSNTYLRLNTFQPLSALSGLNTGGGAKNANTYMLSDYSTAVTNSSLSGGNTWGWPLILPSTYDINTVNNFYEFYSLSAVTDNTIFSGLIDYNSGLTTVSFDEPLENLEGDDNIFDINIRNSLFSSLSLF